MNWVAMALVMWAGSSLANDSAWGPFAGSVSPMEEHPTIVMESADIDIALREDRASGWCAYVLYNEGPATTVTMGFPIYSGGGDSPVGRHEQVRFSSKVDGTPVAVRTKRTGKAGTMKEVLWYIKDVHFEAGQRRTVINRFRQPGIGEISNGESFFKYIVSSARSWRGPIERLGIEVHWYGKELWRQPRVLPREQGYTGTPEPHVAADGRTLKWRFVNADPDWNLAIYFWMAENARLLKEQGAAG